MLKDLSMLAREDRTHRQEILQHLPVSYRERETEKGKGVHVLHISTQNLCVCVCTCVFIIRQTYFNQYSRGCKREKCSSTNWSMLLKSCYQKRELLQVNTFQF